MVVNLVRKTDSANIISLPCDPHTVSRTNRVVCDLPVSPITNTPTATVQVAPPPPTEWEHDPTNDEAVQTPPKPPRERERGPAEAETIPSLPGNEGERIQLIPSANMSS